MNFAQEREEIEVALRVLNKLKDDVRLANFEQVRVSEVIENIEEVKDMEVAPLPCPVCHCEMRITKFGPNEFAIEHDMEKIPDDMMFECIVESRCVPSVKMSRGDTIRWWNSFTAKARRSKE